VHPGERSRVCPGKHVECKTWCDPAHELQKIAQARADLARYGPVHVEYALTELGLTLSAAFCGVWVWAAENLFKVETARNAFDKRAKA